MRIFDSHAHYDDEAFENDRVELLGKILPEKGVWRVVNCGASLEGSERSLQLSREYPYIYAAVGVHPEEAAGLPPDWLDRIRQMAAGEKVVAIGEIGLDYHYEDACPREEQKRVFEEQLRLANELCLPVIVHDREAHGDTMELLTRYPDAVDGTGRLPDSVMAQVARGESPVHAYERYALEQYRMGEQARRTDQQNRASVPGSARGLGAALPADPFTAGWDSEN